MCFSAEASFTSAGILFPLGFYCLHSAVRRAPRYWPLAVVPGVFGIQQLFEGLVWMGIDRADRDLVRWAAAVFLFFAVAFWPFWFSLTAALIERQRPKRTLLFCWALLSTTWFWAAYLPLLGAPDTHLSAQVVAHSIHYGYADAEWMQPVVRWSLRGLYVLTATLPLLAMSERRRLLGPIVLGIGSALTAAFIHEHAFTSVWCFFAAVLSVSFALVLARVPEAQASAQS